MITVSISVKILLTYLIILMTSMVIHDECTSTRLKNIMHKIVCFLLALLPIFFVFVLWCLQIKNN